MCGRRFQNGEYGASQKQEHLDWHFHVNTRIKEGASRAKCRNWYLSEEEWITESVQDKQIVEGIDSGSAVVVGGGDGEKSLKLPSVAVPTDALLASQPCPICKERFKSVWDEDREEWVWPNAVLIDGRIYHATCHGGTKNSTENDDQHRMNNSVTKRTAAEAGLDVA